MHNLLPSSQSSPSQERSRSTASSDSLVDLSKSVSSILNTNFPPLDLNQKTHNIKNQNQPNPESKIEL